MPTKICRMCQQVKDLDLFYVCAGGSQGRQAYCKPCSTIKRKEEWDAKRALRIAAGPARKQRPHPSEVTEYTCIRCKQTRPVSQFGTEYLKRSKRETINSHCRPCAAEYALGKWRALKKDNPILSWARACVNHSRIRAQERSIPHTIVVDDLLAIADPAVCAYCAKAVSFNTRPFGESKRQAATVDRIYPKLGYVRGNVALACYRCNTVKNDTEPGELMEIAKRVLAVAMCATVGDLPTVGDHSTQ